MTSIFTASPMSQGDFSRSDAAFRGLDDRLLADIGIGTEEYEARMRKMETPRAGGIGEWLCDIFALPAGVGGLPGVR